MKTYRIRIVPIGKARTVTAQRIVTVSNADELRGEIENYCMALEDKYSCAVRCESVELIKEDNPK